MRSDFENLDLPIELAEDCTIENAPWNPYPIISESSAFMNCLIPSGPVICKTICVELSPMQIELKEWAAEQFVLVGSS